MSIFGVNLPLNRNLRQKNLGVNISQIYAKAVSIVTVVSEPEICAKSQKPKAKSSVAMDEIS